MGQQSEPSHLHEGMRRGFTRALLADLRTLERMIREDRFETGVRRIGAEQELFLVDRGYRPAPVGPEVLDDLEGDEFTAEIGRFNLEINLPPLELEGDVFTRLEEAVRARVAEADAAAGNHGARVALTGILPTLAVSDLSLDNLTPRDRYRVLNETLTRMSGGSYRLQIQGADEIHSSHDSVMLEGCNTSFQVHLQVSPREFPRMYNAAQAVTAPVLAAAANSPLLFGRRLWAETRVALFQQSLDTRRTMPHLRELTPRVRFGESWVESSVLELYREDVARIPVLFGLEVTENSLAELNAGRVPELSALQLYNGTVYRWNRPCYGVHGGRPHLRIECRALPSGPTVADEVANAAFWVGSVLGVAEERGDVSELLPFHHARANFRAAARHGLGAGFTWPEGRLVSAPELILEELLPLARRGLDLAGVADADVRRWLGLIRERVEVRGTGAQWLLRSLENLGTSGTETERMAALCAATVRRQESGEPGHEWELATMEDVGEWRAQYRRVEQVMTTDLFTVQEEEPLDLAASVMHWRRVRQIPVEDEGHRLVGVVSYDAVLEALAEAAAEGAGSPDVAVKEVMNRDPLTLSPETPTLEAIQRMRRAGVVSCPVLKDDRLVGILSVGDLAPIAERCLERGEAAAEPPTPRSPREEEP